MNRVIDKRRKHLRRKLHIRKTLKGTALRPRLTVFRSNMHMYIQVIDDEAGNTLCAASTVEKALAGLKNNVEDAAKFGEIAGKRMLEKNIKTVVFDRSGYMYHGIVKSIADGARKSGVQF